MSPDEFSTPTAEACAALKHNMQSGREPVLTWLRGREGTQRN
jgi:hypothetical protein